MAVSGVAMVNRFSLLPAICCASLPILVSIPFKAINMNSCPSSDFAKVAVNILLKVLSDVLAAMTMIISVLGDGT